jgi:hypothetical protein
MPAQFYSFEQDAGTNLRETGNAKKCSDANWRHRRHKFSLWAAATSVSNLDDAVANSDRYRMRSIGCA